jgi:hypothetical protein
VDRDADPDARAADDFGDVADGKVFAVAEPEGGVMLGGEESLGGAPEVAGVLVDVGTRGGFGE